MVHAFDRCARRLRGLAGQRLDLCRNALRQERRRRPVPGKIRRDVPARRRHVELLERRERLQGEPYVEFRAFCRCRLGALLRQRRPRQRDRLRCRPAERGAPVQLARPDARSPLPARQPAFRRCDRRPHRRGNAFGDGRPGLQVQPPRLRARLERAAGGRYALSRPDSES